MFIKSETDLISLLIFCCCCSCSCWGDLFKKLSHFKQNQDEIFSRNVPRVNAHRLTESDYGFDVRVLTRGHDEKCCHMVSKH